MKDPFVALMDEGLLSIGSVQFDDVIVIGDPGRFIDGHAEDVDPGEWRLFLRIDEFDRVSELIMCHSDAAKVYYDAYDNAEVVAELTTDSGRVAVVDAVRRLDATLLKEMFEPDDLPWLVDNALVTEARSPVRIYRTGAGPARVVGITFGPAPIIPRAAPVDEV